MSQTELISPRTESSGTPKAGKSGVSKFLDRLTGTSGSGVKKKRPESGVAQPAITSPITTPAPYQEVAVPPPKPVATEVTTADWRANVKKSDRLQASVSNAERFPSFRKTDFNWDAVDVGFCEAKSSDQATPEKKKGKSKHKKRYAEPTEVPKENGSPSAKKLTADKNVTSPSRAPLGTVNSH